MATLVLTSVCSAFQQLRKKIKYTFGTADPSFQTVIRPSRHVYHCSTAKLTIPLYIPHTAPSSILRNTCQHYSLDFILTPTACLGSFCLISLMNVNLIYSSSLHADVCYCIFPLLSSCHRVPCQLLSPGHAEGLNLTLPTACHNTQARTCISHHVMSCLQCMAPGDFVDLVFIRKTGHLCCWTASPWRLCACVYTWQNWIENVARRKKHEKMHFNGLRS